MRQEKEIKGTEIRKENIKLLLSADDMTICVGNPHESTTTTKTLELKSEYIKMAGYMVQLVQFNCSVMSVCDAMDCSMPGFPVHHQLPELA